VSDRVGVNSETVSYIVRPGDRYYLWVDNFDTRGTNFTIEGALSAADGAIRPTLSRVPHVVGRSVARKTKR
jgi:hypothetical protein